MAATFPHAAFPEPRSEAFLREPSESNRPFAFPYNKWHCAQMNVDQAAAILVCSADAVRRLGIEATRPVYPVVALESSLFVPVSRRRAMHRWPAMEVLGARSYTEIDDLLIAAALDADRHFVIIAEPGNDQERLGLAIHMASPRRRHPFKVIPPEHDPGDISLQTVRDVRGGTMLIWLPLKRRLDPAALACLLAPEAGLRLILCAPSIGKVNAC